MNTASLIDLVTSVDVGSMVTPLNLLNDAVNAVFKVVGDAIAVWPAGSTAAAGSIQAGLGSLGGLL
ncbi:hypothetical protein [Prescottella agglutinans]|uniref:Uncharacterized protein n=1 Tax=Prescottella agglutinans TaxID=1644129 RepID=A0ABT6M893_9NOCA|nr:hypothetical protein [Prescottella agglutinans]MDH6280109.1 hypothetical protein [Prescottella agglutinans]